MKTPVQKRLALLGAAIGIGAFIAANVHLVAVAFQSEPACALPTNGPVPARRAC